MVKIKLILNNLLSDKNIILKLLIVLYLELILPNLDFKSDAHNNIKVRENKILPLKKECFKYEFSDSSWSLYCSNSLNN